jgi:hypothetical protein
MLAFRWRSLPARSNLGARVPCAGAIPRSAPGRRWFGGQPPPPSAAIKRTRRNDTSKYVNTLSIAATILWPLGGVSTACCQIPPYGCTTIEIVSALGPAACARHRDQRARRRASAPRPRCLASYPHGEAEPYRTEIFELHPARRHHRPGPVDCLLRSPVMVCHQGYWEWERHDLHIAPRRSAALRPSRQLNAALHILNPSAITRSRRGMRAKGAVGYALGVSESSNIIDGNCSASMIHTSSLRPRLP